MEPREAGMLEAVTADDGRDLVRATCAGCASLIGVARSGAGAVALLAQQLEEKGAVVFDGRCLAVLGAAVRTRDPHTLDAAAQILTAALMSSGLAIGRAADRAAAKAARRRTCECHGTDPCPSIAGAAPARLEAQADPLAADLHVSSYCGGDRCRIEPGTPRGVEWMAVCGFELEEDGSALAPSWSLRTTVEKAEAAGLSVTWS